MVLGILFKSTWGFTVQPTLEKTVEEIQQRLARVEAAIFGDSTGSPSQPAGGFAGPSGGIRLLIQQDFFRTKRSLTDVRDALAAAGYHYGAAPVQTALNRMA